MNRPVRSRMSLYPRRALAAVCCALLFVANVWVREYWTIDDALIFQNFVRNFAAGEGLVYGPGTYAEGYSSPLWVVLLGAASVMGAKGLMAAKSIGTVLGLGCVVLVAGALPREVRTRTSLFAGALVALQPALAWWSVSGMETPLMAFLLTCVFLGFVHRRVWLVGAAAGLLSITRPEAPMYTAIAIGWLYALFRREQISPRQWMGVTAVSVLPWLSWEIFRVWNYGAFIANSALAKLGVNAYVGQASSIPSAWLYLSESFFRLGAFWLAVCVAAALHMWTERDDEMPLAVAVTICATLIFIIVVGGDWMPWLRFLTPLIPMGVGWAALAEHDVSETGRRMLVAVGAFALMWTLSAQQRDFMAPYALHMPSQYSVVAKVPQERRPFVEPVAADPVAHFYAAITLRFTEPGEVVFHADIGQPGYLSHDIEVMDAFGLVSRFEAEYLHARHSDSDMVAHFRAKSPALVFLIVDSTGTPAMATARPLVDALHEGYAPVARSDWNGGNEMLVLVRRDALGRQASAKRLERWTDQAPGLRFDTEVLLRAAESVHVESTPTLATADQVSVFDIQQQLGW